MATTYAIPDGRVAMAATLYTGTLLSNPVSNAVNGVSFQPDLVWLKSRSAATSHKLTDSVRGVTKGLVSNSGAAETTDVQGLTAFSSGGFTVGTNTDYNNLAATYVGWQWKGGGTPVSNTAGSITSSVSANTTAGFSVVTYTGIAGGVAKTFGHGLGVSPSMVIVKGRDAGSTGTDGWVVWHSAFTGSEYIHLNVTNAKATSANYWGATVPSSTVVTVGGNASNVSNESGIKYVAYCFAAVAGYSAFGSYTGNGSSDGPFIYTGMRSRYFMVKRTDAVGDWYVFDTSRDPSNATTYGLIPNNSGTDTSYTGWGDILSNGFKIRRTDGAWNASGGTYIYYAVAENPFAYANAR